MDVSVLSFLGKIVEVMMSVVLYFSVKCFSSQQKGILELSGSQVVVVLVHRASFCTLAGLPEKKQHPTTQASHEG